MSSSSSSSSTSMVGIILKRIIPFFVVIIAILIGVISKTENPMGTIVSIMYTIPYGYLPPILLFGGSGGFQSSCPIPDIPRTMKPIPLSELFGGNDHTIELSGTGDRLPQIGLSMCCRPTTYDFESVRRTIVWYLLLGGRHIDTSDFDMNLKAIGTGMKEAMKRGNISRYEIFITTKISPIDYGYFSVLDRIPEMLEELQVDYVDMILLHSPSTTTTTSSSIVPNFISSILVNSKKNECQTLQLAHSECRATTWNGLAVAQDNGWVRNIGVRNFNKRQLKELQALNRAIIAVNQFELSPWSPFHWQEAYRYCIQQGITIVASSFSSSSYSSSSSVSSMIQTNTKVSTQNTLNEIAKKHECTITQILFRWLLQKGGNSSSNNNTNGSAGGNVAIIPNTDNPQDMKEYLQIYNFQLTNDEMKRIDRLKNDEIAKKIFATFVPQDDT